MSEAGSGGRISYSDFLAQLKDYQQETKQQKHEIKDIVVLKHVNTEGSMDTSISELSESSDIARLNFIERKAISERKALEGLVDPELKSSKAQEAMRKIMEGEPVVAG